MMMRFRRPSTFVVLLTLVALVSEPIASFAASTTQSSSSARAVRSSFSPRSTSTSSKNLSLAFGPGRKTMHRRHHDASARGGTEGGGIKELSAAASTTAAAIPNDDNDDDSSPSSKMSIISSRGGSDATSASGGTATIPDEIFNLVKSIVGAGVLSLPAGIAAFGNAPSALLPAFALIGLVGGLSAYTFLLLARVCRMTGATSYSDAWDRTRGTKASWVVSLSTALDCLAGNLSYSMILADAFRDLFNGLGMIAGGVTRTQALVGVTVPVLLPLCLVKNLSTLAPFSLLGIMGMVYTGLAIGIRYFGGGYKVGGKFLADLTPDLQPSFGSVGASGVWSAKSLILICMLSTAYIAHFNAPKFYRELKDNTMPRFQKVVSWSFGISTALYAAVSALGFLTFGAASQGLILNNYSTKDALFGLSRFAVALSLVFSYPLLFVGSRDGVLDLLRVPDEKRTDRLQNNLTVVLLAGLTGLAMKLRDLSFVSSMSGAVFGTALIFIYPALMFRAAVTNLGEKATKMMKVERSVASVIVGLGVVVGAIGTKMALGEVNLH